MRHGTRRLLYLFCLWFGASLLMAPSGSPSGCVGFYSYEECKKGEKRECYSGAKSTIGKGACKVGSQTCKDDNSWGECQGELAPAEETCNNKDDNCDGAVDDGDICPQGEVCKSGQCTKGTAPPKPGNDTFKGSFVGASGHQSSGDVATKKDKDEEVVTLAANFQTDSGPDLKVYLSEDPQGTIDPGEKNAVDLGPLKSVKGTQTYTLPAGKSVSSYKSVVIWCKKFSVNFGYATLTKK